MGMKNGSTFLTRRGFIQAVGVGAGVACGLRPAGAQEPGLAIEHGPCLQAPGTDEMTIAWHTNRVGLSKVLYGTDGALEQSAVSSHAGLIPNDSTCHAIRVTGLTPGTTYRYKAVTREFRKYKTPYSVEFGDTVESGTFSFTTFDPGKSAFSFLMWSDIHDEAKRLEAMFKEVSWDGVDFCVFNGDMINDFVRREQPFTGFYDASVSQFAKTLPMVFVRGNHETRGPMARRFDDYFPGRNGRYYWSFDHGPAHFIVLDSGEDKPDGNKEYAGLVDFAPYRQEQAEWLHADLDSHAARRAKFRIVLSHQPSAYGEVGDFGCQELRRLWDPIINEAGVQLWLSGHVHHFMQRAPYEDGQNVYHAVVNPKNGTTRVEVSAEAIQVTVVEQGGKVLTSTRIPSA